MRATTCRSKEALHRSAAVSIDVGAVYIGDVIDNVALPWHCRALFRGPLRKRRADVDKPERAGARRDGRAMG
jgi:hypothetical protein